MRIYELWGDYGLNTKLCYSVSVVYWMETGVVQEANVNLRLEALGVMIT